MALALAICGACAADAGPGSVATDTPAEVSDVDVWVPPDVGAEVVDAAPDVEPDTPPTDVQVCTPSVLFCAHSDEPARCADDGRSWESLEICAAGKRCDVNTFTCLPVTCTPGEPLCLDGKRYQLCNSSATGPDTAFEDYCPQGTWCFEGEGCLPVDCTPETYACLLGGASGRCDGSSFVAQPNDACHGPTCLTCAGEDGYLSCPNPGLEEPQPTDVQDCPPETACSPGLGCMPRECTPLAARCATTGSVATCNGDGESWWSQPCAAEQMCVELSATAAECQIDCSKSVDCKLDACDPLPPLGDSGGEWVVPANANTLQITFSVGLTPDMKTAFVNIAPIVNPQTGTFLTSLVPYEIDPTTGQPFGNIIVREDGLPMDIKCLPLSATEYAQVDVAFIIDTTGSMSGTIDKVKQSAVDLATFWSMIGLDVRFAVMPYDDYAPAESIDQVLNFTPNVAAVTQFVSLLQAAGGGDWAENGLDALDRAYTDFAWRPGAQHVMLLMTDAPVHVPGDGSGYAATALLPLLEAFYGEVVVHTMSPEADDSTYMNGEYPNPRLLSCVTGGTAVGLGTFVQEEIEQALFAVALGKSFHCVFNSAAPSEAHTVQVEIHYLHQGAQQLYGSTTKAGVSYLE